MLFVINNTLQVSWCCNETINQHKQIQSSHFEHIFSKYRYLSFIKLDLGTLCNQHQHSHCIELSKTLPAITWHPSLQASLYFKEWSLLMKCGFFLENEIYHIWLCASITFYQRWEQAPLEFHIWNNLRRHFLVFAT